MSNKIVESDGYFCILLNPMRWQDWESFDWDGCCENIVEYVHVQTIALSLGHPILITDLEAVDRNLNRLEEIKDELVSMFGEDALDDSE